MTIQMNMNHHRDTLLMGTIKVTSIKEIGGHPQTGEVEIVGIFTGVDHATDPQAVGR